MARVGSALRYAAPAVLLAASLGLSVAHSSEAAAAPSLPPSFSLQAYPTGLGLYDLTNFAFIPGGNGSMLVTGKAGAIMRVDLSGQTTPIATLTVFSEFDRGLVGIDVAADYATSKTIYTLYDYLKSGQPTGRLSKWTVNNAAAPTSIFNEAVILDDLPSYSDSGATCDNSHTVGTVLVAPDGTLYVGNGDGSSYCATDVSALLAQDITSPRGKIFHVNPDGSGVSTNHFYQPATPSSWQSRVFAYGLRNPFRFELQPNTNTLYIGDVGWNTWEELDIANGGQNFGWPCYEGQPGFDDGYQAFPTCVSLYNSGGATPPDFTWPHDGGNAAVGGDFYPGGSYPASYNGSFFFADYAAGRIYVRSPAGQTSLFGTGVGGPTALHAGPGGDIFFSDLVSSKIYRLRYSLIPNQFPVAVAASNVTAGLPPLTVNFNAKGSYDPDAGETATLTYAWDFGDGATSSGNTASHTYTQGGTFTAKLTVTDVHGASDFDTISINSTNAPPQLTVDPLPPGTTYSVGSVVPIVAHATDPDGPTPTITYQQVIHHCPLPGSCHLHPSGAQPGPQGSFTCTIPDHGDDSYLEVIVTAIDSGGATASSSVTVPARKRTLRVSSSPPGVPIIVNATNSNPASALSEIVGSQNHLIAPVSYGNLAFDHWSDGQARDHLVTMPDADLELIAVYKVAPVAPVPPPSAGGWTLNGSATLQGGTLVLTPPAIDQRGSAWWPTPVPTEGLRVGFDATIDPGHGADGLTFAMADPSAGAVALGDGGAGLGFGQIPGVAVALDTFRGPNDPSSNFVGLAVGAAEGQLLYAATSTSVPDLSGTHHVDVDVVAGHVKVSIDGQLRIDKAVILPNQALLGFTAGTGGLTDRHSITNVSIQPPAASLTVSATTLDFGFVGIGTSAARSFDVSNAGSAPLSVQGVTTAGGPFAVTGAPAAGTVLSPGQSATVTVALTPPAGGAWSGTATVTTSAGDATLLLKGSASSGAAGGEAVDGVFTPVEPYRLIDTRRDDLSPMGRSAILSGGRELALGLLGQPGAPAHPTAAMLNVTVTNPAAAGFVRAYPCGTSPYVSTVNFDRGQTAANLATVRMPADGRVCFWSMVDTDLVVDVAGWFAPAGASGDDGGAYHTVEPVRVLDTRAASLALGGVAAKLAAGQEMPFTLAGRSGFPLDARAALLNLTVTAPDGPGYLRVYPCGQEQVVSNVNFVAGQTVANLAAVMVASGGQVCFRASTATDLVVDLAGWYGPGAGGVFGAPDPVRVLDTRDSRGRLEPGTELALAVTGHDGVPAGASSVVLNVTAASPAAAGYVRVYPCRSDPLVSNVNYRGGQVAAANLAVVKLSPDGRVCFTSFAPTDLVVDLAGWYTG